MEENNCKGCVYELAGRVVTNKDEFNTIVDTCARCKRCALGKHKDGRPDLYTAKEFIMVETFAHPASVVKYLTTREIPRSKILSLVHDGERYVLFYYTTIHKEDQRGRPRKTI